MTLKLVTAAIAAIAMTSAAYASDDNGCTKAPKEQWLSIEQISAKLTGQGYEIREIEMEESCVEAKVRDKAGSRLEFYLDPVTGEVSKKEEH